MNDSSAAVTIDLRIPGTWQHPGELIERLPPGCRLTPEALRLPDGSQFEFNALPADEQFPSIFRSSCRRQPTSAELATVDQYAANICLSGPGGSMESAHAIMQAAAVIIRAGGAGVFIDNSMLAHGGELWLEMTEMGGPEALSFAFVSIIRGKTEVYTIGMHVIGLRDIVMNRADMDAEGYDIIEVIRYLAEGEVPVDDGHVIAGPDGPRFKVSAQDAPAEMLGRAAYNPFGRLKLVSFREIGEAN